MRKINADRNRRDKAEGSSAPSFNRWLFEWRYWQPKRRWSSWFFCVRYHSRRGGLSCLPGHRISYFEKIFSGVQFAVFPYEKIKNIIRMFLSNYYSANILSVNRFVDFPYEKLRKISLRCLWWNNNRRRKSGVGTVYCRGLFRLLPLGDRLNKLQKIILNAALTSGWTNLSIFPVSKQENSPTRCSCWIRKINKLGFLTGKSFSSDKKSLIKQ